MMNLELFEKELGRENIVSLMLAGFWAAQGVIFQLRNQDTSKSTHLVLGITHGGRLKEKMLKNQLEGRYNDGLGVVIVPKWSEVDALIKGMFSNEDDFKKALAAHYYILHFVDNLLEAFYNHACGVVCDANLGWNGADNMTLLVREYLANHPRISALRLFTAKEACQLEATEWAKSDSAKSCYKLLSHECVGDHSTIRLSIIELKRKLLNEASQCQEVEQINCDTCSEKDICSTVLSIRKLTADNVEPPSLKREFSDSPDTIAMTFDDVEEQEATQTLSTANSTRQSFYASP